MSLTLPRVADNSPFPVAAYNEQADAVEGHDDRIAALELHQPIQVDISASEGRNVATYGDLATVGPSITLTLTAGQKVTVFMKCEAFNATATGMRLFMGFAVSGATTLAPDDETSAKKRVTSVNDDTPTSMQTTFVAIGTGSHTFTAKYRADTSSGNWQKRRMILTPH